MRTKTFKDVVQAANTRRTGAVSSLLLTSICTLKSGENAGFGLVDWDRGAGLDPCPRAREIDSHVFPKGTRGTVL